MLIKSPDERQLADHAADVVVIGAGPLGIVTALSLADQGRRVLVLESGGTTRAAQDLAEAEVLTPETHHAADITTARRLGGAGNLWGGRCVPFDAIDFAPRPWLDLPAWPVGQADLDPWLAPACAALGAGDPVYHDAADGVAPRSDAFSVDRLERWSNQPRTHKLHATRLAEDAAIAVALETTATGFRYGPDGRVTGTEAVAAGRPIHIGAPEVILAGGGNASVQLLLNEQARRPALFGGADGPLGRFYMGHVNGQIADIVLTDEALHDAMDFYVDAHGSYVRRRITPSDATQRAERLANVAFWPVVPEISQAEHGSGPLSAVFLALSFPGLGKRIIAEPIRLKHVGRPPYRRLRHIRNLLTDPLSTLSFVPSFLWRRRYARYRVPGFFLRNPGRRYGLEFHAEHLPQRDSRLTLSNAKDATGLRRLRIDFRFSDEDAASVIRAHRALEEWLAGEGYGRLIYRFAEDDLAAGVFAEAKHGNHQIGTIRMGGSAADGVVDGWGTCFDVPNLHVVSTAILPTSSQANPTLLAAQLGLRLANRLAATRGGADRAA